MTPPARPIAGRSEQSPGARRRGTLRPLRASTQSQPRLKDVAEAAGVHVATASRALNDDKAWMISPTTAARVRSAAVSLGYRVNGMARALKTRRSFAIGMLLPDITNPFFPPIVRGAEDALSAAGFTLVLGNTDNNDPRAHQLLQAMLEQQIDGILIASARRDDPAVEQLRETGGIPFPKQGCGRR